MPLLFSDRKSPFEKLFNELIKQDANDKQITISDDFITNHLGESTPN